MVKAIRAGRALDSSSQGSKSWMHKRKQLQRIRLRHKGWTCSLRHRQKQERKLLWHHPLTPPNP